jgi:hypothetical protein
MQRSSAMLPIAAASSIAHRENPRIRLDLLTPDRFRHLASV